MAIVEFKEVSRVYRNGDHEQRALDRVNLQLEEGKFMKIYAAEPAGRTGQPDGGDDYGERAGYFHAFSQ